MTDAPTPAGEDTAEHDMSAELVEQVQERLEGGPPPAPEPEGGASHDLDGSRLREWLEEHDRPLLERYEAERVEVEPVESEGGEAS